MGNGTVLNSIDNTPWEHPFLTKENIVSFRRYSHAVWGYVQKRIDGRYLCDIAFCVNMAQNMYKWTRLAREYGAQATLYLHPHDTSAISRPEWENYDGEFENLLDGENFLLSHNVDVDGPYKLVPFETVVSLTENKRISAKCFSVLIKMLPNPWGIRYQEMNIYPGCGPYIHWAKALAEHDVSYSASMPLASYFSGTPYCVCPVGGDVQFDCGRGDWYGEVMSKAFRTARFILVSNPHMLGHCRRLGFSNALYLPYPMDSNRYSPGSGKSRSQWVQEKGDGLYVLSSSRLDAGVKGHGNAYFSALAEAVKLRPELRFVFLQWGESVESMKRAVNEMGLSKNVLVLPPVGKKRLIDYYRSCDVVLDTFVYGYYGATALEAASIGKPVVMKIRSEHYDPLYGGDVMPAENASSPADITRALIHLAKDKEYRDRKGLDMREWLVRTHGQDFTVPLMLALLKFTARNIKIPKAIAKLNPLLAELSPEELAYHRGCLQKREIS